MESAHCLEENELGALAAGLLDGDDRRAALEHVESCPLCCAVLAEVADPDRQPLSALLCQSGDRVGRYVILEQLGAGAAAVVYAAYDPALDRRVALKLLLTPRSEEATARLRREAQALGRLSHEAVVAVHDVGSDGPRLFIAMDLMEGGSLRRWLAEAPRAPGEVLRAFLEAGRGLAAAHAAGVLHRDFKPDNVLCARDGRVRVSDFGLARLASAEEPAAPGPTEAPRATETGGVGTPAYMAPEQWGRGPISAQADQFAFAASLYEALYGQRPFAGDDLGALQAAAARGAVRPRPRGSAAPRWIHPVLLRALSPSPAARYPSMDALLAALRAGPPWRRRGRAAALCLGAVALALLGWRGLRAQPLMRCLAEAQGTSLWALGAEAPAWRRAYRQGCFAAHLRHERPVAAWERQAACLWLLRDEAEARRAQPPAGAGAALPGPRDLRRCAPALMDGLRGWPQGEGARELGARLGVARALASSASSSSAAAAAAAAQAEALRAEAHGRGLRALEAEALLVLGALRRDEEAVATLKDALWTAQASRHDAAAAEALVLLCRALPPGSPARARWRSYAAAVIGRIGGEPSLEAALRATP